MPAMCQGRLGSMAPAEITEGAVGVWEGSREWERCLGVRGEEKHMATFIWPGRDLLLLGMWGEELLSWEDSDISCLERTLSCRAWAPEQSRLSPVIRAEWDGSGAPRQQQAAALHLPCPEAVQEPE